MMRGLALPLSSFNDKFPARLVGEDDGDADEDADAVCAAAAGEVLGVA